MNIQRPLFRGSLSRVCFTLGLGHFLCVPPLYFLFDDSLAQDAYRYYLATITLSGAMFTIMGFASRSRKSREWLPYALLGVLFLQTCLFLYQARSLFHPATMLFPLLCTLATPISRRQNASLVFAFLSVITLTGFHFVALKATADRMPTLIVPCVIVVISAYLAESLWRTMRERERELRAKSEEMERWIERFGRASELISTGDITASLPVPPPSRVFEELTKSVGQMREKLHQYFTRLFLQDRLNSLGVLASGVAHELNTPLTTMQFVIQSADIPEDAKENLLQEIERMSAICKDLLSFARPEEEKVVDLNDIVKKTRRFLTTKKTMDVTITLCDGKLPIRAAANEIQQILLNLFKNAEDALEQASAPKISVRTVATAEGASIEIEDNGCGIEKDSLARVLDPFFTTKPPGKGTGLGLFIVHQISQRHRAWLEIESEKDKGTIVRVRFPSAENQIRKEAA